MAHLLDTAPELFASVLLALCAGIAAVGYGSALGGFLKIRANLGDRGILGLLSLGLLGCLIHFGLALSFPVEMVVLAIGVLLAILERREITAGAGIGGIAVAGICLFMLLHPQSLHHYDSGLYQIQTLRWNRELPVTPGLGNLHGRLAFNSILFLIAPLTDRAGTGWITNLLAITFVWMSLWSRFRAIDRSDPARRIEYWFLALTLGVAAVAPGIMTWYAVLNADSLASCLIIYFVALAIGFSASKDRSSTLALMILSAALGTAAKLSAAPLVALAAVFGVVCRRDWFGSADARRLIRRGSAIAGLFLAAWMARGIVLSGCAIYPVSQTCAFSLPWAESGAQVRNEAVSIRNWARIPGQLDLSRPLSDWTWAAIWMHANRNQILIELFAAGLIFGILALLCSSTVRRTVRADVITVLAGLMAAVAFWFVAGPDPRFGAGFLFAFAMLGLSLGCAWVLANPRFSVNLTALLIALMAIGAMRGAGRLRVMPDYYFFEIPQAAARQVRLADGTGVWVPMVRDQCWDHELPCAPNVDPEAVARIRWRGSWTNRLDRVAAMGADNRALTKISDPPPISQDRPPR